MPGSTDILILGTGSFAARIANDIAATASQPTTVVVGGRNGERLKWIETATNARATIFGRPVRTTSRTVDLMAAGAAADIVGALRPKVIVQAASLQTASVIASKGDAWAKLVAEGGLSTTAVFQTVLSARVARAVRDVHPAAKLINCCFADVGNSIIAAMGLPVLSGIGNVAILSNAIAGALAKPEPGRVRVLAHYQTITTFRKPANARTGLPMPRVWVDGAELADVARTFERVQLTPEPVIDISGASGVPLMLALAEGRAWQGHTPAPNGLVGGYPVKLEGGNLSLDLPSGLSETNARRWNEAFEEENGLVVERGRVTYRGLLGERFRQWSPDIAAGFAVGDLEAVYKDMAALRSRLQATPAS